MKLKKIPYNLFLLLLTFGASTIIAFLSFTGTFTLLPLASVAIIAAVLSVSYEGEIYLQNIRGALNKLFFKPNYLKEFLAKDYLLKNFPNTDENNCPLFFHDYKKQINLLSEFSHKSRLTKQSKAQKKQIKKTLRDMDKWFMLQLFSSENDKPISLSPYAQELRDWLKKNGQEAMHDKLKLRQKTFVGVTIFSILSGIFMGIGISYLLVDAFAVLPFFSAISLATLPTIIVPMAIICGTAYIFLIYNAVTDMINHDTLGKWYSKIRADIKNRNPFIAVSAILLLAITIALTVCTAGTWWTIAKNARPIFSWMVKMPTYIMGVINPAIMGISQLVFNLQNTSESLEIIDDAIHVEGGVLQKIRNQFQEIFHNLIQNENRLQLINPFRFLLKITLIPLRVGLFFGHIISNAANADRFPGLPEIVAFVLGATSELFGDGHYFLGDLVEDHHHHAHNFQEKLAEHLAATHGHSHHNDIPTRIINLIFSPLYFLAASWDYLATRIIKTEPDKILSFKRAWKKQHGLADKESVTLSENLERPSGDWQAEQAVYGIDKYINKHLGKTIINPTIRDKKMGSLRDLQVDLLALANKSEANIVARIQDEANNETYNSPRFFNPERTRTCQAIVNKLPQRISTAPAA